MGLIDFPKLIKNIYQIKPRICQNIYYFCLFMLQRQSECFSFHDTGSADHFLFLQNSWVVHSYSVICKFIMSDILADTAILSNASKKEPMCSCYEHTSRACLQLNGMAAEKRGLCLSGKSVNMQLFLNDSHGL